VASQTQQFSQFAGNIWPRFSNWLYFLNKSLQFALKNSNIIRDKKTLAEKKQIYLNKRRDLSLARDVQQTANIPKVLVFIHT